MGEIRHEGGRLVDGLRGSSREERSPLATHYFRKGKRREGKRRHFEGAGKRTPSLLNVPPTNAQTSNVSMGNDYGVKACIIFD
jgi:hypothetical protein